MFRYLIMFIIFMFGALVAEEVPAEVIKTSPPSIHFEGQIYVPECKQKVHSTHIVFHGAHAFICFDDCFYIHDPDCGCDSKWVSSTQNEKGKTVTTTLSHRVPVSHYD